MKISLSMVQPTEALAAATKKKRKTHNSFLYDVYFPFVTTRLVWSRWKLEQKLYDMLAGRLFGWKIFTFQHLRERESLMSDLSVDEKRELMLIGPFLGGCKRAIARWQWTLSSRCDQLHEFMDNGLRGKFEILISAFRLRGQMMCVCGVRPNSRKCKLATLSQQRLNWERTLEIVWEISVLIHSTSGPEVSCYVANWIAEILEHCMRGGETTTP